MTSAVQAAEQLCGMLAGSLSVPSKFPRTGYAGSLGPRITAPGSSVNSEGVTAAFSLSVRFNPLLHAAIQPRNKEVRTEHQFLAACGRLA